MKKEHANKIVLAAEYIHLLELYISSGEDMDSDVFHYHLKNIKCILEDLLD